jgi:hypothetical protein
MRILLVCLMLALWGGEADAAGRPAPAPASSLAQEPTPAPPADEGRRNGLVALALVLGIASSSLALGIAFGIRRRIDMLAGPPPDDEDD